jgi:hypothetical protein
MDRLEVQARWDVQGNAHPHHFRWQDQEWTVDSTGRRWKDSSGEHILCLTRGQHVFELIYHPLEENWSLGFHNESPDVV